MLCPSCRGQSPTVEQLRARLRDYGDTSGACDRCNNTHEVPDVAETPEEFNQRTHICDGCGEYRHKCDCDGHRFIEQLTEWAALIRAESRYEVSKLEVRRSNLEYIVSNLRENKRALDSKVAATKIWLEASKHALETIHGPGAPTIKQLFTDLEKIL